MSIEEIIKHCKKDNQIAQGLLFDMFYNQLYHLAMRMLMNGNDVEDVLSIMFIRVFKSMPDFKFQGDNSFKKWIKTITINESIRFLQAKKRLVFEERLEDVEDELVYEDYNSIDINTEKIYAIIETMPDGYRMVFNLFALEEYSHKEISEQLNISINTSKSQLRKARKFIIEKLVTNDNYGYA